jgi:hypothetical protein
VVVQGPLAAAAAEIVPNSNFHASCSTQLFVGLAEAVARNHLAQESGRASGDNQQTSTPEKVACNPVERRQ